MPPGVVTVTCTVPVPAGALAVISVPETTVNELAGVVPNESPVSVGDGWPGAGWQGGAGSSDRV